ncbi:unnamed protein product [Adineta ricciae]|uniref:Uncharacterized protein n=1 Tax=Adineta ricciae TaxID=249248 RepID=A0A815RC42_ADIRI|nr:unnamed protein product [Adineta ricciae]
MLISVACRIFSFVRTKGDGGYPQVKQKAFQLRVPNGNTFTIQSQSLIFTKVPGIALALSDNNPMLYELQFETICREPDTKFYKNHGSSFY